MCQNGTPEYLVNKRCRLPISRPLGANVTNTFHFCIERKRGKAEGTVGQNPCLPEILILLYSESEILVLLYQPMVVLITYTTY